MLIFKSQATAEISVGEVAKELSAAGDQDQAEFFNKFFHYLLLNCRTITRFDNQLSYIRQLLEPSTKARLKILIGLDECHADFRHNTIKKEEDR